MRVWLCSGSLALSLSVVGTAAQGAEGIDLEEPVVQRLAVSYYVQKYGVDEAEATRRIELQDRAADIDDRLAELLGADYAEMWYDHADRGRLKIGVTKLAVKRVREIRSLVSEFGVGDDTDLVAVEYSLAELVSLQDKLRSSFLDLIRLGQVLTNYDPKRNRVTVIALAKLGVDAEQRLRQASAISGVRVERWDVPSLMGDAQSCGVTYCDPPLRGGRSMFGCTTGFMARHTLYPELKFVLTAGHCIANHGGIGASWYAYDESGSLEKIGKATGYVLGGEPGVDAGAIYINPYHYWGSTAPVPRVVVTDSNLTSYDPNYPIRKTNASIVGKLVCFTGAYTDTNCAEISDVGQDFVMEDGNLLKNLGELDFCETEEGDSGGPIYKHKRAYGMHVGAYKQPPLHCFAIYQGIRSAEWQLNMEVLKAP